MPQQPPEEVLPEIICPFWTDGHHCWNEETWHGHVDSKTCACGARIKARDQ